MKGGGEKKEDWRLKRRESREEREDGAKTKEAFHSTLQASAWLLY